MAQTALPATGAAEGAGTASGEPAPTESQTAARCAAAKRARRADPPALKIAPVGSARSSAPLPPLGAHVSSAGGFHRAARRAKAIGADALQLFTTAPQRWLERQVTDAEVHEWKGACADAGILVAASHDSYLINLASSDSRLLKRSVRAFRAELERCEKLGLHFLVTHPGNATGGHREAALRQNAELLARAVEAVPGSTCILIETTAGSGSALGWRFEEVAALLGRQPTSLRERFGACLDTAHVFAAGYDLKHDYAGVMKSFDEAIGLERLKLIHCNDSLAGLGTRRDRHADIGRGEIGEAPFRALMRDPRLSAVPRVLETPKGDDPEAADRRNLSTLRRLAHA